MLWSSTSCGHGSFFTAPGSSLTAANASCTARAEGHHVRCCADYYAPSPSPTSTYPPTPQEARLVSLSPCSALQWDPNTFGDSMVCGNSLFPGGECSGSIGWGSAVTFCQSGEARLCTADEL